VLTSAQVPTNAAISNAAINGDALNIAWESGHESTFPLSFLRQASYDPPMATRNSLLNQTPYALRR